jgi:hypothetical protein
MTWLETLTSTPVLIAGALGISAALFAGRASGTKTSGSEQQHRLPESGAQLKEQVKEVKAAAGAEGVAAKMAQAVSYQVLIY